MSLIAEGVDDRRLLVIGATSGVGRALAHVAAGRDARVVAAGRRRERLETLRAETSRDTRVAWTEVGDSCRGQSGNRPMALNLAMGGVRCPPPDAPTVMSQSLATFELNGESGTGMCERSG
jgi:NAD(P)-dependent dehydrogenase (short-subunit alcohol dehydrogenase family)